eukprot:scaffold123665_cov45-Attheya_sp.AAC.1
MSTLNANFPRSRESDELDEIEEATSESSIAHPQFVYENIFPRVIIIQQQHQYPLQMLPPPIDSVSVIGQDDGGQDFIIRRRRLSYLGNIFRSWQRAVISQATFSFPERLDVQNAVQKTTRNIIHYEHDNLSWRLDYFISARADRKTLVV